MHSTDAFEDSMGIIMMKGGYLSLDLTINITILGGVLFLTELMIKIYVSAMERCTWVPTKT